MKKYLILFIVFIGFLNVYSFNSNFNSITPPDTTKPIKSKTHKYQPKPQKTLASPVDTAKPAKPKPYKYQPKSRNKLKKETENVTDDGFYINIGASLFSKKYFVQKGFNDSISNRFSLGPSLEIGNMFRIAWNTNSVVGLRISWLTFNYTRLKLNNKIACNVIQASLFKFGPYVSTSISNVVGLDVFAQIAPTYAYNTKDTTKNNGYAGFPFVIGFDCRFEGITLGADYNTGRLSLVDNHIGVAFTNPQIGYIRIFAGYKF